MRRCMRAAAWLMMIVLAAVFPLWAASVGVKTDRRQLIWKNHNAWTGVLRLWKCEGWQSGNGTLTAWLNTCIEKFEKQHKGVYIQLSDVSEQSLRDFAVGSVNPPDMILYAPGMLDAPYDLIVLEDEMPLKSSLSSVGRWQGERYAVPVAMGGYALAVNRSILGGIPENWKSVQLSLGGNFVLDAPADSAYNSWSAALMALFSGSTVRSADEREPLIGDGIDLGLPLREAPLQSTSAGESDVLPDSVPKDFRRQKSVYSRFTAGTIAAMPVTQYEIRRLEMLEESGRAPDWQAAVGGIPFTDQIALLSVTARQAEDMEARQQLCIEFMKFLLSVPMQQKLTQVRAFSVCDIAPMYSGRQGMSVLEQALSSEYLLVPDAFSSDWRSYAEKLMNETEPGESTYGQLQRLREMLMPYRAAE